MKKIKVTEAVGEVLGHDITKIVPGEFKGVAFKKGHIIREEDIPELQSIGKNHIYVWEDTEGVLHENDAAKRLRDLTAGKNLYFGDIKEGKIEFFASIDGIVNINTDALYQLNHMGEIIVSTIWNHTVVKKGDKVAATKIVPLSIAEDKIKLAESLVKEAIIDVIPIKKKKCALITTGSEVYKGRIKDATLPVLKEKLGAYDSLVMGQRIVPDDTAEILNAINLFLEEGAEMIILTGGMSVDADDLTPKAIKDSGADIITYGSPVLPGAMLVVSYNGDIPVLGLPANIIFAKKTVFDLILPRILSGEKLTKEDIALYGHGGLLS